jgi:hypothetical protein
MSDAGAREWRFYLDDMITFAENVIAYAIGLIRSDSSPSRCALRLDSTRCSGQSESCCRPSGNIDTATGKFVPVPPARSSCPEHAAQFPPHRQRRAPPQRRLAKVLSAAFRFKWQ